MMNRIIKCVCLCLVAVLILAIGCKRDIEPTEKPDSCSFSMLKNVTQIFRTEQGRKDSVHGKVKIEVIDKAMKLISISADAELGYEGNLRTDIKENLEITMHQYPDSFAAVNNSIINLLCSYEMQLKEEGRSDEERELLKNELQMIQRSYAELLLGKPLFVKPKETINPKKEDGNLSDKPLKRNKESCEKRRMRILISEKELRDRNLNVDALMVNDKSIAEVDHSIIEVVGQLRKNSRAGDAFVDLNICLGKSYSFALKNTDCRVSQYIDSNNSKEYIRLYCP